MSEDDGVDPTDFTCRWGGCTESFEDAEQLDSHVKGAHVKAQKVAALKPLQKGVVCEWANCLSDKVHRDSWNLVTHIRYKHTHFRPYACSVAGCTKRFVQLHQMKKHSKTPHETKGAGRGRKKSRDDGADVGGASGGGGVGAPPVSFVTTRSSDAASETNNKRRSQRKGKEEHLSVDEAAEVLNLVRSSPVPPELLNATAAGGSAQLPHHQNSAPLLGSGGPSVAAVMLAASSGVRDANSPADNRPFTPLDRTGLVSPTSLLFSNTQWHATDSNSRVISPPTLWSPFHFSPSLTPIPSEDIVLGDGPPTPVSFIPVVKPQATAAGSIFRPIPAAGGPGSSGTSGVTSNGNGDSGIAHSHGANKAPNFGVAGGGNFSSSGGVNGGSGFGSFAGGLGNVVGGGGGGFLQSSNHDAANGSNNNGSNSVNNSDTSDARNNNNNNSKSSSDNNHVTVVQPFASGAFERIAK